MFCQGYCNVLLLLFTYIYPIRGFILQPTFEIVPRDLEVNPNTLTFIPCRIKDGTGECIWLKDGVVIGNFSKYTFHRTPTNGDCSIVIKTTKLEDDDGLWRCKVTNALYENETLESPEVKLTVIETPLPPLISGGDVISGVEGTITVDSNKTMQFNCTARRGNPPPVFKWFLDALEIENNITQILMPDSMKNKTWMATSILDVTLTSRYNDKALRCVAMHVAYETGTKEAIIRLNVLYLPNVQVEVEPKNERFLIEGMRVTLWCLADANPPAEVFWKKVGYPGNLRLISELAFAPITRTDSGKYTCLARNDIGESKIQFIIDVNYPPNIQIEGGPMGDEAIVEGSSLMIRCTATANPEAPIIWRKYGVPGTYATAERLIFDPINRRDSGVYNCSANNKVGQSEKNITLDIKYPPDKIPEIQFEGEAKSNNSIIEGTKAILKCLVDANPSAKIIWRKFGYYGNYAATEQLEFSPISRNDSGVYFCSARNDLGFSEEVKRIIEVQYKPKVLRTYPSSRTTANLHAAAKFNCEAEGNPPPRYSWLQRTCYNPVRWREQAASASFSIENVMYASENTYICQASNVINGLAYTANSKEIYLDVKGPPEVITDFPMSTVGHLTANSGETVVIRVFICADPEPKIAYWEVENDAKININDTFSRFSPSDLESVPNRADCYEARLTAAKVKISDSKMYSLFVENDIGRARADINLKVKKSMKSCTNCRSRSRNLCAFIFCVFYFISY